MWNSLDAAFILTAVVTIVMVLGNIGAWSSVKLPDPHTGQGLIKEAPIWWSLLYDQNLYIIVWMDSALYFACLPILYLFSAMRLLKFFQFHAGLSAITRTLQIAGGKLIDIIAVLFFLLVIFSAGTYSLIGGHAGHPDFQSFTQTLNTVSLLAF